MFLSDAASVSCMTKFAYNVVRREPFDLALKHYLGSSLLGAGVGAGTAYAADKDVAGGAIAGAVSGPVLAHLLRKAHVDDVIKHNLKLKVTPEQIAQVEKALPGAKQMGGAYFDLPGGDTAALAELEGFRAIQKRIRHALLGGSLGGAISGIPGGAIADAAKE